MRWLRSLLQGLLLMVQGKSYYYIHTSSNSIAVRICVFVLFCCVLWFIAVIFYSLHPHFVCPLFHFWMSQNVCPILKVNYKECRILLLPFTFWIDMKHILFHFLGNFKLLKGNFEKFWFWAKNNFVLKVDYQKLRF